MKNPQEEVAKKLSDIRLKLLDLGKRNKLLNFRYSKSCIRIVDEQPNQVFDYLVNRGKAMTFLDLPEEPEGDKDSEMPSAGEVTPENTEVPPSVDVRDDLPAPRPKGQESPKKHSDDKLQTKLFMPELETRLRRVRSSARSVIEETGKNQLFLAMGFLSWKDRADTTQICDAPLILIPVELTRGKLDKEAMCYTYSISNLLTLACNWRC